MKPDRPVIVLLGPTAVGKPRVSLELAKRLDGEIISADSRLVYRGMDIGTAKPSPGEMEQVPHHLIDIRDPEETYSLAEYRQDALAAIEAIHRRGRLPLLVGGTGQYLKAVIEGWVPPPRPEDFSFRDKLESWVEEHGHEALHDRLRRVDPDRAAAIDSRNVRRVIRALEIYDLTGVPPSKLRVKIPPPFDVLQVGLIRPREELYERIDRRIEHMLEAGWLEEIKALLDSGIPPQAPPLSAIGYRQLIDHLRGEMSLEEAVADIQRLTRQFVRRQANWFKQDDPEIHWFKARPGVVENIEAMIRKWLNGEPVGSN